MLPLCDQHWRFSEWQLCHQHAEIVLSKLRFHRCQRLDFWIYLLMSTLPMVQLIRWILAWEHPFSVFAYSQNMLPIFRSDSSQKKKNQLVFCMCRTFFVALFSAVIMKQKCLELDLHQELTLNYALPYAVNNQVQSRGKKDLGTSSRSSQK